MRFDCHRAYVAGKRKLQQSACVAAVGTTLTGCPPDTNTVKDRMEEQGSKENRKSGAGDDRRSLQDISGAERPKAEPRRGSQEPGGK